MPRLQNISKYWVSRCSAALASLNAFVDERVVEDLQVLQRIEQPADVVVSMFKERGVDLHLTGENRLERRRHVVVAGDFVGPLGEHRIGGDLMRVALGDIDLAFDWLRRSCDLKEPASPG